MRLSEIKELLRRPSHSLAESLVNACHEARIATGRSTPREDVRARVMRFLEQKSVQVTRSAWTGEIVVLHYVDPTGMPRSPQDVINIAPYGDSVVSWEEYTRFAGFRCETCSSTYQGHWRVRTLDRDLTICSACAEEHFSYCEFGEGYCEGEEECTVCSNRSRGLLSSYSTNVTHRLSSFRSLSNEALTEKPLWLGVELEVEPKHGVTISQCIASVHRAVSDFAILKPDSSVPDGFEIVSVPATLAWHRETWARALKAIREVAKSWRSPDCGMHVHLSREALTPLQLGKLLVFINSTDNQNFVWQLAGRLPNGFTHIKPRSIKHGRLHYAWDHHDALAVSERNNGQTMEMRIFRGNLSEYGFLKNLDFVAALVAWSAKASIKRLVWQEFVSWIQQPAHRKSYPYLDRWLTAHGYYAVKRRIEDHPFQD